MAANPSTAERTEPVTFTGGISKRVLRFLKAQVEDWYDDCRRLSLWEEQNLADQLKPELLSQHAQLLDELERVGRWLSSLTESPEFSDTGTAQLVSAALQDLRDRRALWHGNMDEKRRKEILHAVFNEP